MSSPSLRSDGPPIPADVIARAFGLEDEPTPEQHEPTPPHGRRCSWPGCEAEAVAVALRTGRPYCRRCALFISEELRDDLRREVVWFPVCEIDRCGRLATARIAVARNGERERFVPACPKHQVELVRLFAFAVRVIADLIDGKLDSRAGNGEEGAG